MSERVRWSNGWRGRRMLGGLAAMALIAVTGCSSSTDADPSSGPGPTRSPVSSSSLAAPTDLAGDGSVPVTPGTLSVLRVGTDATVTIPVAAVAGAGTLTGATEPAGFAATDAQLTAPVWDFALAGTGLVAPARLTLPVIATAQVDGMPPVPTDGATIAYYKDAGGAWTPVPSTVDAAVGTVSASVEHLSRWHVVQWNWGWLGKTLQDSAESVLSLNASDAQPACDDQDRLTDAGVTASSSDGDLLRWCAEPYGEDSVVVRVVNPYSFSVELASVASAQIDVYGSGDSILDYLAQLAATKLVPAAEGAQITILAPGQSADIVVGKGDLATAIQARPSGAAAIVDALGYALKTATMVWGKTPGATVDPGRTQQIAEFMLNSDECTTNLRNLAFAGGERVDDITSVLEDIYTYSFTCLKPAWEKGYGSGGVALTFFTSALSWLADGIGQVIGDSVGTVASLRFATGWQISLEPVSTPASSAPTRDFTTYVGLWERHTSGLAINADGTGSVLFGSGCCNSVSVPLSYAVDDSGALIATVTGPASYEGSSFRDVQFAVGDTMITTVGQSEPNNISPTSGPILLMSNPFYGEVGVTEPQQVWCGSFYDYRCGA